MLTQIKDALWHQGYMVKDEWLRSQNTSNMNQINYIKRKFLDSSIEQTCEPILAFKPDTSHPKKTSQYYVVEIVEVVDISLSETDRIHLKRSPRGTLKFLLNAGGQLFIAIEKSKLPEDFNTTITPGTKLEISPNADFIYGVLFLTPDNCRLLGGMNPALIYKRKHIYGDKENGIVPPQVPQPTATQSPPPLQSLLSSRPKQTEQVQNQNQISLHNNHIQPNRNIVITKITHADRLPSPPKSDQINQNNQIPISSYFTPTPGRTNETSPPRNDVFSTPKPTDKEKDVITVIDSPIKTSQKPKQMPKNTNKTPIYITPSSDNSPHRTTQRPHKDVSNFDLSSSDEEIVIPYHNTQTTERKVAKPSPNDALQTPKPKPKLTQSTKQNSFLKSSDSYDFESEDDISSAKKPQFTQYPTKGQTTLTQVQIPHKEPKKLDQPKVQNYFDSDDEQSNMTIGSSESESPARQILSPPTPGSATLSLIQLLALREVIGNEYFVKARFSRLGDLYTSNNQFVAWCDISNGNLISKVALDTELILHGLEIRSVIDYINLDDSEIPRRKEKLAEYLSTFSPPLKVLDKGMQKDGGPRFMLMG